MPRFSSSAGIAIGPILFVLAILGVLAMTMSNNIGSFSAAGVIDRISADVTSQANLIRSKIVECNMVYSTDSNNDGYPASDSTGTLVSTATCSGDLAANYASGNIWSGARPTQLPPPTTGFNEWTYINAGDSGGRCFWTSPKSGNASSAVVAGLTKAATKFSSQEVSYVSTSSTQKFVIFVTRPSGAVSSYCSVP